ncbi:MAG: DUF1996 domain-containing protein [Actinomycetota bacterium]
MTTFIQATPAHAFSGGSFLVICDFVKFQRIDPIMDPGVAPTEHLHMFFGNKGISKNSTYTSLVRGTTTCSTSSDRSAYWAPVVYRNGHRLTPYQVSVYYVAAGRDRRPFPQGFMERTMDARFSCGGNTSDMPRDCGGGKAQINVRFFHRKYPDVHVHYKYNVHSLVGARLSSGRIRGAHGDFFPAWANGKLGDLIRTCLNQGRTCGKIGRRT